MAKKKPKRKQVERICKNCKLYNPSAGECAVVVLHEGQRLRLPVDPEDACFFEEPYFDPTTKAMEDFADDLKEVKFWVEDKDGNKTDKDGVVKFQYPQGFFGKGLDAVLDVPSADALADEILRTPQPPSRGP